MDEKEAIHRLKRGDIKGLECIVRLYQVEAIRAANMILRDAMRAEDVVQEVFLRVYKRIATFDVNRPLRPWLMKIVVNEEYRAVALSSDIPLHQTIGDGEITIEDVVPSEEPLLAEAYEIQEMKHQLWDALGKLSPEDRTLLTLRYFLAYSEQDVADMLECPLGTAKWRLYRARNNLKNIWQSLYALSEDIRGG